MELKVSVDGVQRVVCGVTEKTTCQEVVIALAQALGRTGRYTLREKFKEFERNVTPEEQVLESLGKYGEQARDVQLTLHRNGPSAWDEAARLRGSRQQAYAQLRSPDAVGRVRGSGGDGGGGGGSSHRQSLPPLSRLRLHAEPHAEETKKPKRKSLTLMEEAWGWLENLGRGGKQTGGRDKGKSSKDNKGSGPSPKISVNLTKYPSVAGALQGRDKKEKRRGSEHDIISCLGNYVKDNNDTETDKKLKGKQNKGLKNEQSAQASKKDSEAQQTQARSPDMAKESELRALVIHQQVTLRELQLKVELTDQQISELEEAQRAWPSPEDTQGSEEAEQLQYWLNELKAEEGYEKDLQRQFLEMKEKAAECKAKLKKYQCKIQGLAMSGTTRERMEPEADACGDGTLEASNLAGPLGPSHPSGVHTDQHQTMAHIQAKEDEETRLVVSTVDSKPPCVMIYPTQTTALGPCGQTERQESWTRWSETQRTTGTRPKVVHRSEMTIHLGSSRV